MSRERSSDVEANYFLRLHEEKCFQLDFIVHSGIQSPFIKLIVEQDNRLSETAGRFREQFHKIIVGRFYYHCAIKMHFASFIILFQETIMFDMEILSQ